jgi:hypothetical protein
VIRQVIEELDASIHQAEATLAGDRILQGITSADCLGGLQAGIGAPLRLR